MERTSTSRHTAGRSRFCRPKRPEPAAVLGTQVEFPAGNVATDSRALHNVRLSLEFCRLWGVLFSLFLAASIRGADPAPPNTANMETLLNMSLSQLLEVRVDTVFGASKYEQKISEAPSSVTIINRDEIKKQGYRSLAEILRGVRGLFVTEDRTYTYLGIRGFGRPSDYNSRVLILVDGHRLNDNIYDSVLVGSGAVLDVDNIEKVEIIRGPSSSIYGDNAFFGVINVISRSGHTLNGAEISGEVGGQRTYKGRFNYGNRWTNGLELLVSGSWYDSKGERNYYFREFDTPGSNHGIAHDASEDRYYKLFSKLGYGDFSFSAAWSERSKDIPTASFGTLFNDGGERVIDRYGYLDLKHEHTFENGVTFLSEGYFDSYRSEGDYPFSISSPGDPIRRVLNRDMGEGEWGGIRLQATGHPIGPLKVIAGGDFRADLKQHRLNFDVAPHRVYTDAHSSTWNIGAYAQAEWSLRTNLLFNGGGRVDYYETFGTTVNPRISIIYGPRVDTTLKFLYGQAYRAPNAYELAYGNVRPETIRTYEIVWEQDLPAHLQFVWSGYIYQINDLISDSHGVFSNLGQVEAHGVEWELAGKYPSGIHFGVSYALQKARNLKQNLELSDSPRQLAKGSLSFPIYSDHLFAGLELQYTSAVKSNLGRRVSPYFLMNLTLYSHKLTPGLEVSASLYNLLDTHYFAPVSTAHVQDVIQQEGRNFRVVVTYHF